MLRRAVSPDIGLCIDTARDHLPHRRMSNTPANQPSHDSTARAGHELLVTLVQGIALESAVPAALELVEQDPLVSAGQFPGDVLRALMEVPGRFWGHCPQLFDRYREALRAGAARRRTLPPDRRFEFWSPLGIRPGN